MIEMRLWNAQGGRCFHCGEAMLITSARKGSGGSQYDKGWTREHIVPRKLGGKRSGNIVLAHHSCNTARNHAPPGPRDIQRCKLLWQQIRPRQGGPRAFNPRG